MLYLTGQFGRESGSLTYRKVVETKTMMEFRRNLMQSQLAKALTTLE